MTPSELLLLAILMVESGGNDMAVGDHGKALGPFQIWEVYLQDTGLPYSHEDMHDRAKAKAVVKAYMRRYAKPYKKPAGMSREEFIARIHNGGPRGYRNINTVKYWHKVKAQLEILEAMQ